MRTLTPWWSWVLALAACGPSHDLSGPDAPGPDALGPDMGEPGGDLAAVPPGCHLERTTEDRPDDHGFDQIRVLYVVPSDGSDAALDTNGKICNSVRAFATWFYAQAGSYLRFDTHEGLLDIGFVRLGKTDVEMRGSDPNNESIDTGTAFVINRIERELAAAGLIASNKLYAVYYDGTSTWACGAGAYPPLIPGRLGAMYLDALPIGQTVACGESYPWGLPSLAPGYVDYAMLHELVHAMGIVSQFSPHHHSTGHVFDTTAAMPQRDLMYSPRMGQPDPAWGTTHPDGLLLDLGNDDYFQADAAVELGRMSLLAPLPDNATRPGGW